MGWTVLNRNPHVIKKTKLTHHTTLSLSNLGNQANEASGDVWFVFPKREEEYQISSCTWAPCDFPIWVINI